jgi:arylsulfatase A-like enzyme
MADDLGIGDPRCYNAESKIPTPHIDRLAVEGMRFTDAHSPSAVCTPTRYGLLTGRYCWRGSLKRSVLLGYSPMLIEQGRPTVASFLKGQGYTTAAIGKWHLGLGTAKRTDFSQSLTPGPVTVGFDYFFGISASLDMAPYVWIENDRVTAAPSGTIAASKSRREGGEGMWREGAIAPGFRHMDVLPTLSEKATAYIAGQKKEQPFFLYLPLTSPHTPWVPDQSAQGRTSVGPYGDFVAQTDDVVGAVLAALDKAGLSENTLVVMTSDNGSHWLPTDVEKYGHKANAGWRGQKADIWEGGHRIPLIVRWPGKVQPGSSNSALVCLTDLFATFAEVTGAQLPGEAEDSVSFLPVLTGRSENARQSVVNHSIDGTFAIREGQWKLIPALGSHGFSVPSKVAPQPGGPEGQLYDLGADPGETRNLWSERADMVTRLSGLLKEVQEQQ